jgi:hypothetical protein
MKRFIMLALVLTFITGTAFSKNTNEINQKVLTSFSKKFTKAEDVQWEIRKDLFRAKFKFHGQVIFAYFNSYGEQVALSRNITIYQLPVNLATDLQATFHESWLTELFEVSANGETSYYATVESATHTTMLKADNGGNWYIHKKDKKQE